MGLERPIGLESWWGLEPKVAPKVGPIKVHLGAPQAYISKGKGEGRLQP